MASSTFYFAVAAFLAGAGLDDLYYRTRIAVPPAPPPDSVSFSGSIEAVLYKCDGRRKCPSDLYKQSTHTLDDWYVVRTSPFTEEERTKFWRPVLGPPFGNDKDGRPVTAEGGG